MTAETDSFTTVSLEGAFDLHVHTAPDVRPRWHTCDELADRAADDAMRGFVAKHHHQPTVDRAAEAHQRHPNVEVYGGIVLNEAAGGLDPAIVQQVLNAGGRFVWLPTLDGQGERHAKGLPGGIPMLDTDHAPVPALREIFALIAAADAILATGHIHHDEVLPLIRAARDAGVKRILVNHPEIPFLDWPIQLQQQLARQGAILEYCYPRPEARDGFDRAARQVKSLGIQHCVLATDLGRTDLPAPLDGLREMIAQLKTRGFTDHDIDVLTRENPAHLVA